VFFADLSPIVLRLFFVFKTEYNRRTNEEQTANNTARGKGAAKCRLGAGKAGEKESREKKKKRGREKEKEDFF